MGCYVVMSRHLAERSKGYTIRPMNTERQDPYGHYFDGRAWHPRPHAQLSEAEWLARVHLFLMDLADALSSAAGADRG